MKLVTHISLATMQKPEQAYSWSCPSFGRHINDTSPGVGIV